MAMTQTLQPEIETELLSPVVQTEGLSLSLDDRPILRDINLQIDRGDFLALLGHNGAGKSTLLHILALLRVGIKGDLKLFNQTPHRHAVEIRRRIGLIGHQPMLYRDLTARENLIFFGRLYDIDRPASKAMQLLEQVGLKDRAEDTVKTFSRGMVQRVSIARALMHDPELILADEPFSGLDLPSSRMLESLLTQLNELGHTIILAHHDIHQAIVLTKRTALLKQGTIIIDRPREDITAKEIESELISQ